MIPSQLLGLGDHSELFFALVLQCICLGLSFHWLPDIYDVAFICCPLNCMMIARCYEYDLKNILGLPTESCWASAITWTPRMLFLESIEILLTITKKIECASVAESPPSVLYLKSWKSTASCFDIHRCNFSFLTLHLTMLMFSKSQIWVHTHSWQCFKSFLPKLFI